MPLTKVLGRAWVVKNKRRRLKKIRIRAKIAMRDRYLPTNLERRGLVFLRDFFLVIKCFSYDNINQSLALRVNIDNRL